LSDRALAARGRIFSDQGHPKGLMIDQWDAQAVNGNAKTEIAK
jgi:hypothetical protein